MDVLLALAALLAAIHGFFYARWLVKQDIKDGAFFVYLLIIICISLPIYKMLKAP